ncbi:hypothetical protein [Variovorax terrae]|uniref:Uncharacterized protein n=1 Tax=Variovorax terrae TaxID=2923278 RepID=A0A9X1VY89_9BURK|nr:hypothetical protein [Variovorax terrae]MCJ0764207.1 hypothetical protein [Variovorax terrae]
MRTYDKLIATIHSGQGNGGLRPSFGGVAVSGPRALHASRTASQDSA